MPVNRAQRAFLTASWRRLILAQYETDPALLEPRLPRGLTLDEWEGRAFVSVVAFDFLDTRVRGMRVPGCVNFPEVNLRFYVTDGDRRGVCFVRELVPSWLTATVARVIYNEPYAKARMRAHAAVSDDELTIEHRFEFGEREHRISATCDAEPSTAPADSIEHHFKEHEWGFGRTRRGVPTVYRVAHPEWLVHRVRESRVEIDAGALYGPEWAWLSDTAPASVVVAEGSDVAVFPDAERD
ncbi:MAG: hypothetical protein DHS20C14_02970 [Phycisphaeraceae bacterium]|nr:MAG: hypothetical protein DHS20C14_02970 [Phycisphaeraceae bacterium]